MDMWFPLMDETKKTFDKLHGYYFEDLELGMWGLFSKTISEAHILAYAGVSGDTNPLHLDKNFGSHTIFKSCVAHGMLAAGLISTVIGTKLPGPESIYLSQSLRFKAPVFIGDTIVATVKITKLILLKKIAELKTTCSVREKAVLCGEAKVLVPSK